MLNLFSRKFYGSLTKSMQANSQLEEPPQPSNVSVANVLGTVIATLTLVTPLYVTAYYSAQKAPPVPWFQQVAPYRAS